MKIVERLREAAEQRDDERCTGQHCAEHTPPPDVDELDDELSEQ
jgi:hypothetical protein